MPSLNAESQRREVADSPVISAMRTGSSAANVQISYRNIYWALMKSLPNCSSGNQSIRPSRLLTRGRSAFVGGTDVAP